MNKYYLKLEDKTYYIVKSTKPKYKYDVYEDIDLSKYKFSFGSREHQHFKDKLGEFKHLDHNDDKRRKAYYSRWNKQLRKLLEKDDPSDSPLWFSTLLLW
jgi:hypothetical protein